MTAAPPAALKTAIKETKAAAPDPITLQDVRAKVAEVRDLEAMKADIEERLKETNIALQEWCFKKLPDLFDEIGINDITLAPEGNSPGVKATASPFYRANIAADWPPDQRQAAFDYLDSSGNGDLVKTDVVISYSRQERHAAIKFAQELQAQGLAVATKDVVPWTTLTAWLKESVEKHGVIPPLDVIGGTVGRVVKLKPIKEK